MTIRVAVTSDLHFDPDGHLTRPEAVRALAERIRREKPDVVILAGDLAHGLSNLRKCLACFSSFQVPMGVIAGNHDLWRDAGHSSIDLWQRHLPEAAADAGAVWLEGRNIVLPPVGIVGSLAWYDYSGVDPAAALSKADLARIKPLLSNDATWIDWRFSDPQFAEELLRGFQTRLQQAAALEEVSKILVVTHVPIVEGQVTRKKDPAWAASNAYFGNLTTGKVVLSEPKVGVIVSGHTHIGRKGTVRSNGSLIDYFVVPSGYGKPGHLVLDL